MIKTCRGLSWHSARHEDTLGQMAHWCVHVTHAANHGKAIMLWDGAPEARSCCHASLSRTLQGRPSASSRGQMPTRLTQGSQRHVEIVSHHTRAWRRLNNQPIAVSPHVHACYARACLTSLPMPSLPAFNKSVAPAVS